MRREDRAADIAVLVHEHGGRQMARVGVDGVAEQQELHDGNEDHGRERDAVAPELDELLDEHGHRAHERAGGGLAGCVVAVIGSCPASGS